MQLSVAGAKLQLLEEQGVVVQGQRIKDVEFGLEGLSALHILVHGGGELPSLLRRASLGPVEAVFLSGLFPSG